MSTATRPTRAGWLGWAGAALLVVAAEPAGAWPMPAVADAPAVQSVPLSPRAAKLRDTLSERLSTLMLGAPLALSAPLEVVEEGDHIRVTYRELKAMGLDGQPLVELGTIIQTFTPGPDGRMAVDGGLPDHAVIQLADGPLEITITGGRATGEWDEALGLMVHGTATAAGLTTSAIGGIAGTTGALEFQSDIVHGSDGRWHQTASAAVADASVGGSDGSRLVKLGRLGFHSESRVSDFAALLAARQSVLDSARRIREQSAAGASPADAVQSLDPTDLRALLESLRSLMLQVDGDGDLVVSDLAVALPAGLAAIGIDRIGLVTRMAHGAADPAALDASYGVVVDGARAIGLFPATRLANFGFEIGVDRFRPGVLVDYAEAVAAAGKGAPPPAPDALRSAVGGAHLTMTVRDVDVGPVGSLGPGGLALSATGLDQPKAALGLDYHHDGLRVGGFEPPDHDLPARAAVSIGASDVPLPELIAALSAGGADPSAALQAMTQAGTALTVTNVAVDTASGGGTLTGGAKVDAAAAHGAVGQLELVVRNYDGVVARLTALAEPAQAPPLQAVAALMKALGEPVSASAPEPPQLRFRFALASDGRFTVNDKDLSPVIALIAQAKPSAAPDPTPEGKPAAPVQK